MTNNSFGAYPRSQRIALLAVLIVATLLTMATAWLPGEELSAALNEAGRGLRLERTRAALASYRPPPEQFTFDPNTVTGAELQRLGLSKKQAAGWLKFRGTRTNAFRRPEDIGKLFVLSDDDKARLIPLAYVAKQTDDGARPRVQGFVFDPNVVAIPELRRLGLSEKQAAAFVNYRRAAKYGRMFRRPEDIRQLKTLSAAQKDHLVRWAEVPEETEPVPRARQRFAFDPNTVSEDSLVLLGFARWQAVSFGKYRGDRRTTFRRATDIRRVGALDSALVEEVIPLIVLAPLPSPAPAAAPATYGAVGQYGGTARKAPPPAPGSFDVNSGNLTAWKQLPGVGEFRAKRIVRHRNRYGGFYTLDQLAATPDLPDSTFQQILPYLRIGPVFRRIAINRADFDELVAHPNIRRSLANVIVKNREKFGRFAGPEDLRRIRLITEENLPTILPYLSFE